MKRWLQYPIAVAGLAAISAVAMSTTALAQAPAKPNIVIIWGDDIGQSDISAYSRGMMGFKTPNIDRIANEGVMFTDYYAKLCGRSGLVHHWPVRLAHWHDQGRLAGRFARIAKGRPDDC